MSRCLLLALPILLVPSAAPARMIAFTGGPTVTHVGDVAHREPDLPANASVGYRYDYAGLFWVEFWTWGGKFCIYGGDSEPIPISRARAAELLGRPASELEKPFVYRYPPGLLFLGAVVFLIVVVAMGRRFVQRWASGTLISSSAMRR